MEDDNSRVARGYSVELGGGARQLLVTDPTDDREVLEPRGQCAEGDAVSGIDAYQRHTGHPQHRLNVAADVAAIVGEQHAARANPERGVPPSNVVISRDDNHLAHARCSVDERARLLELSLASALRQVAGDRDDIEATLADELEQR